MLRDVNVRNAKPKEKMYRLYDSGGLYLEITILLLSSRGRPDSVIAPLSFNRVTVQVLQFTPAVALVVLEVALVNVPIRECQPT